MMKTAIGTGQGKKAMSSQTDGLLDDTHGVSEFDGQGLTKADALVRWVLLLGFLAVLSTEVWLLWRAWGRLF